MQNGHDPAYPRMSSLTSILVLPLSCAPCSMAFVTTSLEDRNARSTLAHARPREDKADDVHNVKLTKFMAALYNQLRITVSARQT